MEDSSTPAPSSGSASDPHARDPRSEFEAFDAYQRAAARTLNPALDANDRLLDAAAGMAEEAGEVLALIRKHLFLQRPLPHDHLRDELGDALWCLAAVATARQLSLGDIAQRNLDKLRARHPLGFVALPPDGER